MECGYSLRRKKAKEEGNLEEKLEIALKMKAKGTTKEDIAELTGLSIDEIEKL
ncbi:putative transposase/invertase (TIGR01784 family) [Pedobacter sp. AK017]|uniref:hypothetical protein n=1 Tax=Pedobacter sp. AK017 TaxID=2723073 RepID=UPI00161E07E0|nr:hypothetical protein [Pedobacter sp. AK017]MBB5438489.1 putative transposase/invertase (TIGR01784 family) [Pedobacter sp. AK017]